MAFTPCRGKTARRDDGTRCLTCGRSLAEIGRLRDLLNQLTHLAITCEYDNVDQFAAYVAQKLTKNVAHRSAAALEKMNAD